MHIKDFTARFYLDFDPAEFIYLDELECIAYDKVMEREVRLLIQKKMNPKKVKLISNALECQNIQKIYAHIILSFENSNFKTQVLVLEPYTSGTFNEFLKSNFPTDSVLNDIIKGIIKGLVHIHGLNTYCGVLLPNSIIITALPAKPAMYLAKIAASALFRVDSGFRENDTSGHKRQNLAPELLKLFSPNSKSDIWSLGVLLFEIFTGQQPLIDPDAEQVEFVAEFNQLLEGITLPYRTVIQQSLVLDPLLRPSIENIAALVIPQE
jgi:serine/threonine protein kinase